MREKLPIKIMGALAFIALFTSLLFGGCRETPLRLQPSGINSSFEFAKKAPFEKYIDHYRKIVRQARVDLQQPDAQKIIEANSPFELVPDKRKPADGRKPGFAEGIILIHGLSDSPYHMKYLAEHFKKKGFLVRTILLPGHGTRPGDLTEVTLEAWQKAVDYAVKITQTRVDRLFIGGYSLGGALAIDYALRNPGQLDGLFLFNPSLKVNTDLAWLVEPLSNFKSWLLIRKDRDFVRYESFAANSGTQIQRLINQIDELTNRQGLRLEIPVFIALSREDFTIDSSYTLQFFKKIITNPASRLLLYSADETKTVEPDRRVRCFSSAIPSRQIIGFSHQSLVIPPEDPHYGRNGDYRNCLHYGEESAEFAKCRAGGSVWIGERTGENLDKGIGQRLTWNPKFREMIAEIDDFLTADSFD